MFKRGDVRQKDGFIFWGYERKSSNKEEFREKWLSPEYFARKKKEVSKSSVLSVKNRCTVDPGYHSKIKEVATQNMRKYRAERPKNVIVAVKKAYCKKHGIPFDLTVDDFEIPEYCPLLGIKLVRNIGSAKDDSPELDRIVPSKGYVKGNVWIISRKANRIKYTASIDEIKLLIKNWPW